MKESPLQEAIKDIQAHELHYGDTKQTSSGLVEIKYVIEILEQMELDMLEEFKQGIDNAFKG